MSRPARRWALALRIAGGTLGAYCVATLLAVAASLLLARGGMARGEAVTAASLASFLLFAVLSIMVFHARDAVRGWAWLLILAGPCVAVILFLRPVV